MKIRIVAILLSLFSTFAVNAQTKPFNIGKIEEIKSTILNEKRTLNIYFPDGYHSKEKYPVIYLLDGSANFV